MKAVLGLDPSLTSFGGCLITEEATMACATFKAGKMASSNGVLPVGHLAWARLQRCKCLVRTVLEWVENQHAEIASAGVEGYAVYQRGDSAIKLTELGTILRDDVYAELEDEPKLFEIPPASIKKFATGKGNADKVAVAGAVVKRWGVECRTSDEYDAYVIARMLACQQGWIDIETVNQRDAMAKVWGKHTRPMRVTDKMQMTHDLQLAIDAEDYEKASRIRDAISRMESDLENEC